MNFRALLTHNWRWKLLSLLLAVALWFTIDASIHGKLGIRRHLGEFGHEFAVTQLTAAGDAANYQIEPATVQVNVSGPFPLMQELDWDAFRVFVNLSHPPESAVSAHVVTVLPPPGIQVTGIDPPAVIVRRVAAGGTQPAAPRLSQP